MFQTWIVPVLLVALVVVCVYLYAAGKHRATTAGERRQPRSIRRGKHINE